MKDKLMATSDPELKASLSLRRKKTEEMKTAEKKVESYDTSAISESTHGKMSKVTHSIQQRKKL